MKSSIHSLVAASLLVIPCAFSEAPVPPSPEKDRPEARPHAVHPERQQAQRRERAQAGQPDRPERRNIEAPTPPRPPATGMAPDGPRPEARPTHGPAEVERERRMAMERMERLERAMQERDALMGKAARELSARMDRMEVFLKKSGPETQAEPARPVPDERVKQATREMEARMKHLKEMEAKLVERDRELGKRERAFPEREADLAAKQETLAKREQGVIGAGDRIQGEPVWRFSRKWKGKFSGPAPGWRRPFP